MCAPLCLCVHKCPCVQAWVCAQVCVQGLTDVCEQVLGDVSMDVCARECVHKCFKIGAHIWGLTDVSTNVCANACVHKCSQLCMAVLVYVSRGLHKSVQMRAQVRVEVLRLVSTSAQVCAHACT